MSIVLERLVKRFDQQAVVSDVSLEVGDGEFFVLLGPSGSGKSTVLRMIAGLTPVDSGRVILHGRDVTAEPPQRRGVGLVFQHYALFRNMTVSENVEFALRVRHVRSEERRRRRDELFELVGLSGLGKRLPQELSGGQQQRVALARSLAHRPTVLLLDEPFGALDARIRLDLRRAVRAIQRELGITTIFVTHDQEEAFELADRIGVMNAGRLLEVGSPSDLYLRPKTEFVARFLGTANLFVGESAADEVRLGPVRFPSVDGRPERPRTERVQVLFRPEDVSIKATLDELEWPALGEAVVEETGFLGSFQRLRLRLARLAGVRPIAPAAPFGGDSFIVEAVRSQHDARRFPLATGDRAFVGVRRIHALTHPGLSFLLLGDGPEETRVAIDFGGQIARLAHARVTLFVRGVEDRRLREEVERAHERIGSGLVGLETKSTSLDFGTALSREIDVEQHDLVVTGVRSRGRVEVVEDLLRTGIQHLLLVPPAGASVPRRVLVCVAVGEPGKEDVQFTARLIRHFGADATVVSVLPPEHTPDDAAQAHRFLAACVRSMSLLGVAATPGVRIGSPLARILEELRSGQPELLVLGAPLPNRRGQIVLGPLVSDFVERLERPVLLVCPQLR